MAKLTIAALGLGGLALAGCTHHLDRRDTLLFQSGDAVAANKAIQIIDPWPRGSQTPPDGLSGERAEQIMENLRKRGEYREERPAGSVVIAPIGTTR
jgi:hypothetical protein